MTQKAEIEEKLPTLVKLCLSSKLYKKIAIETSELGKVIRQKGYKRKLRQFKQIVVTL